MQHFVLNESVLNEFTLQFRFLTNLALSNCEIKSENSAALPPNRSVQQLLLTGPIARSNLSFVRSLENLKFLLLFGAELSENFWSVLTFAPSKNLTVVAHAALGTVRRSRGTQLVLSPKKAS